jgi:hypothetical protein
VDSFWAGTFPDWLVGVGTLALAALTFMGLRRERAEKVELRKQLAAQKLEEIDRQIKESDRTAAIRQRSQAEQVVAWADIPEAGTRVISDGAYAYLQGSDVAAWVRNDSSLPIRNVTISWCDLDASVASDTRIVSIVPPRSEVVYFRPSSLRANGPMAVEIEFTDARAEVWRLNRDGGLVHLGSFYGYSPDGS